MECLQGRYDVDPSGEIMVLNRFCPVSSQEYLYMFLHSSSVGGTVQHWAKKLIFLTYESCLPF